MLPMYEYISTTDATKLALVVRHSRTGIFSIEAAQNVSNVLSLHHLRTLATVGVGESSWNFGSSIIYYLSLFHLVGIHTTNQGHP